MRYAYALFQISFRRQLAYRAATLAGLTTNLFFGLLRAAVLVALYGQRSELAGISVQAAITYTGLTQAVIAYLSIFGWYDLMRTVYSGEIGTDLLKPFNFFWFWLLQDFGRAVAVFWLRGVSVMLIYALFFDLVLPETLQQWILLMVALLLALLVSFAWRFLVNLAAFWTPDARGIGRFAFGLNWVLSGFYLPLRFFPDWLVQLCYLTPFPSMVNTPVEIYLGLLTGPELFIALGQQLVWFLVLVAVAQVVLRRGVRRLVIQGG